MTPQELSDRLWLFAARIAKVVDALPDSRVGRHVAGQVVRSGIAAAPNYDEARSGESRADFVPKSVFGKYPVRSCGGAGRLASLLLSRRSTRDILLRRVRTEKSCPRSRAASPSAPPRSQSLSLSIFKTRSKAFPLIHPSHGKNLHVLNLRVIMLT